MAMRDPKEWASWIIAKSPLNEAFDEDFFARLIREAQEDGAREWKLTAQSMVKEHFESERQVSILEAQVADWKNKCIVEAQAVAALTERAERAEREIAKREKIHASEACVDDTVFVECVVTQQSTHIDDARVMALCSRHSFELVDGEIVEREKP